MELTVINSISPDIFSRLLATVDGSTSVFAQLLALVTIIYPEGFSGGLVGIALFILRVIFGILFIRHGYPKIRHLEQWAKSLELPLFLCFIAAWTMFMGGFFLITGLLTPLVSLGLLGIMVFALVREMVLGTPFIAPDPYLVPKGEYEGPGGTAEPPSYEKAVIYCAVMITILLLGPGAFSIDAAFLEYFPHFGNP